MRQQVQNPRLFLMDVRSDIMIFSYNVRLKWSASNLSGAILSTLTREFVNYTPNKIISENYNISESFLQLYSTQI